MSQVSKHNLASLFNELSDAFVPLTDVLLSARSLNHTACLTPLQAEALYRDTHSIAAKKALPVGCVISVLKQSVSKN